MSQCVYSKTPRSLKVLKQLGGERIPASRFAGFAHAFGQVTDRKLS